MITLARLGCTGGNKTHFKLATTGITLGRDIGGSMALLFTTTDCLCAKERDCQPVNSTYYSMTRNGLERIIHNFFIVQETMAAMTGGEPAYNSPVFAQMWSIRQDAAGGLDLLVAAYDRYLTQVRGVQAGGSSYMRGHSATLAP